MEDIFEFVFHGNIYFGNGSRNSLKQIVKENHYNRLCIVVEEGLTKVETALRREREMEQITLSAETKRSNP